MKVARMSGNYVAEIIPEYALPVERWYGAEFATLCREVPDSVTAGQFYDPATGLYLNDEPRADVEEEAEVDNA